MDLRALPVSYTHLDVYKRQVRENEWAAEMQQQSVELGLEDKEEAATGERKLSVDERCV